MDELSLSDFTWWQHLLAVPVGIIILSIMIVVVALVANKPAETFGALLISLFVWWLGLNVFSLF